MPHSGAIFLRNCGSCGPRLSWQQWLTCHNIQTTQESCKMMCLLSRWLHFQLIYQMLSCLNSPTIRGCGKWWLGSPSKLSSYSPGPLSRSCNPGIRVMAHRLVHFRTSWSLLVWRSQSHESLSNSTSPDFDKHHGYISCLCGKNSQCITSQGRACSEFSARPCIDWIYGDSKMIGPCVILCLRSPGTWWRR